MKIRAGFVSNSSSTAFMIKNTSKKTKTIVDFVKENPHLVEEFVARFDWHHYTQEEMLASAEQDMLCRKDNLTFAPGEDKVCIFGDESGTVIGAVFDYILRDGGRSKSFRWKYHDSYR
jgi:hypothetical protein